MLKSSLVQDTHSKRPGDTERGEVRYWERERERESFREMLAQEKLTANIATVFQS